MAVLAQRLPLAGDLSSRAVGDYVRFRCDTQAELPSSNVLDGDSAYAINTKKMFDRVEGAWVERGDASNTGGGGSSVPAGCILMWTGLLSAIPSGWVLCDGANGTPDLRSKFIKGAAAAAEAGDTGGAATHIHADHASHTHAYTQIVNHTHPVTDPGHTHVITELRDATTGGATTNIALTADTSSTIGTKVTGSRTTGVTTTDPAGGVASGTTAGPSAALTHAAANSEPAFYTVLFIMKT